MLSTEEKLTATKVLVSNKFGKKTFRVYTRNPNEPVEKLANILGALPASNQHQEIQQTEKRRGRPRKVQTEIEQEAVKA